MSAIQKLREGLGFNQNQLAIYLGISRSFLNEVEKSKKSLSIQHLNKLLQLEQFASEQNPQLIATEMAEQNNALSVFLQQQTIKNTHKKRKYQSKLEEVKRNYLKAMHTLQTIRTLKNNLPLVAKKDVLWCNFMEANALQQLKKNGLIVQQKLELKINSLI